MTKEAVPSAFKGQKKQVQPEEVSSLLFFPEKAMMFPI